jgi:hypothetical protein
MRLSSAQNLKIVARNIASGDWLVLTSENDHCASCLLPDGLHQGLIRFVGIATKTWAECRERVFKGGANLPFIAAARRAVAPE